LEENGSNGAGLGEFMGLEDILIAATLLWLISYFLHLPTPNNPATIYSDVCSIIIRSGMLTSDSLLIPYRDYEFEYPPIVAYMFIIVNIVLLTIPNESVWLRLIIGYTVMSILLYIHAIGIIYVLCKLCGYVRRKNFHILLYFVMTPSFLIYTNYNWDLVGIFYALLGLYLFLRGKKVTSFILFGFAAAGKIIPAIVALAAMAQIYMDRLDECKKKNIKITTITEAKALLYALSYLAITIIVFVLWNLPFILISPKGWYSGLIQHHAKWYIECSWLVWIELTPFSTVAKSIGVSLVIILITYVVSYLMMFEMSREERVVYGSAALMAGYLFSTYVFTPQMSLMLLPLVALTPIDYVLVIIFDSLNAMIILTWFKYEDIYELLGISVKHGFLDPFSIPQIFATARCIVLLGMLIKLLRIIEKAKTKST